MQCEVMDPEAGDVTEDDDVVGAGVWRLVCGSWRVEAGDVEAGSWWAGGDTAKIVCVCVLLFIRQ